MWALLEAFLLCDMAANLGEMNARQRAWENWWREQARQQAQQRVPVEPEIIPPERYEPFCSPPSEDAVYPLEPRNYRLAAPSTPKLIADKADRW